MTDDISISETGLVGRFTVTVTCSITGGRYQQLCEWEPDVPKRGQLTPADLPAYQAVRNRVIERFARETGLNIAVVDL
jgi:hypothetical protein